MVQHSMEEIFHFQDEEYENERDIETPPDSVAIVRSMEANNEILIRALAKKVELNVVLLQSLSKIQKHLQQGPTINNEGLQ